MSDFRFACPKCNREIQCDVACAGWQINCPCCKQIITAPPAPLTSAPAQQTVMSRKSLAALLVGLGVLFLFGFIIVTIYFSSQSIRAIRSNWTALSGKNEQWNVASGKVMGETVDGDSILASQKEYGNVTFSAKVSTPNREASMVVRMQDAENGYVIVYAPATKTTPQNGYIALIKRVANTETNLAIYKRRNLTGDKSPKLTVIAHGSSIEVQLDGNRIIRASDSTFSSGHIGFRIYGWGDYPCDATYSKVSFR